MKKFRAFIAEVEKPKSELDKKVFAQHPVKVTEYPVADAGERDVKTKKDTSRKADKTNESQDSGEVHIQSGRAYSKAQIMNHFKESEELDEVSKARLGRYIKKANGQIGDRENAAGYRDGAAPNGRSTESPNRVRKLKNRYAGVDRAVDKLTKEEEVLESDHDDAVKKFLARGGTIKKGETKPMDPKLSATSKASKGGKSQNDAKAIGDTHAVKAANEKRAKGTLGDYSWLHKRFAEKRAKKD
jgi:hypothetical protein